MSADGELMREFGWRPMFSDARQPQLLMTLHTAVGPREVNGEWEYVLGVPGEQYLICGRCHARHEPVGAPPWRCECGGLVVHAREFLEIAPSGVTGEGDDG